MVRRDRERYSQRALRTLAAFGLTVDDVGLGEAARGRTMARLRGLGERVITEMRGGCIVAITGPSGAGKSTLLRLIGEMAIVTGINVVEAVGDPQAGARQHLVLRFTPGWVRREGRWLREVFQATISEKA